MTEQQPDAAPELGPSTDVTPQDAAGSDDAAVQPAGASDEERTMETPDRLGGTGGQQSGGAG